MAQQDLIKIHNVKERSQLIAPHEDLVGMMQLIRDARKITLINKRSGSNPEMVEIISIQADELDPDRIYGLHTDEPSEGIRQYGLKAPTIDAEPESPLPSPRDVGTGIKVTDTAFAEDPKNWSRQYHAELDGTVVRQTNKPAPERNAVIIGHEIEGLTPNTPVKFALEPLIRGKDILYLLIGSGDFTVSLDEAAKRYRIVQENVRADNSQDNHDFYIPVLEAVKDRPAEPADVPGILLEYDPQSQTATKISLTGTVKQMITDSLHTVMPELLTDPQNEKLKLKLTLYPHEGPEIVKETEIPLPSLIVQWGEIEGTLADQPDLQSALEGKADTIDIPPMIEAEITVHNESGTAHEDIRDRIYADLSAHNNSATAHQQIRDKTDTDIAAHNTDGAAHADIRQGINDGITAHNADNNAHPSIYSWAARRVQDAVDAHNGSAQSHPDIRQHFTNLMADHNSDPLEDQHPLIRSKIADVEAAIPNLPGISGLGDGEYKLVISGGIASWAVI